jgi:hypothetical protein
MTLPSGPGPMAAWSQPELITAGREYPDHTVTAQAIGRWPAAARAQSRGLVNAACGGCAAAALGPLVWDARAEFSRVSQCGSVPMARKGFTSMGTC